MGSADDNDDAGAELERAIGFMSESAGCFDPNHYHSFKGTSSLLPLRSCAGCGLRLQVSLLIGSSSGQIVQCVACGAFAHRSCGFAKTTKWKEFCSVNFKNFEKEEAENKERQQHATANLELSKREAIGYDDDELEKLPSHLRPSPLIGGGGSMVDSSGPTDAVGAPNGIDAVGTTAEQETSGNIFRQSATSIGDSSCGGQSKPAYQALQIHSVASEDGVLDGGRFKRSKANFPFLSASELLSSTRTMTQDDAPLHGRHVNTAGTLKRYQTWGESSAMITDAQTGPFLGTGKVPTMADMRRVTTHPPPYMFTGLSSTDPARNDHRLVSGEGDPLDHPSARSCTPNENVGDDKNHSYVKKPPCLQWTENGPPTHWATKQSLDNISVQSKRGKEEITEHATNNTVDLHDDNNLHFTSHPFSSVSRALQENIVEIFRPVVSRYLQKDEKTVQSGDGVSERVLLNHANVVEEAEQNGADGGSTGPHHNDDQGLKALLEEARPKDDRDKKNQRLGLATVAGGIAGGVVGLAFAGPVGGAIGAKAGQTAGILGILWEGSVTVGVVASGVAAGRYTGQQLQDKLEEKRVLTLGEDGKRRVLLIRPTVTTDPVWGEIYALERQSFSPGLSFSLLPSGAKAAKRERYEREADIVTTDEDEIPREDKVLLLASRILNNRESLPGHIYRCLLQRLVERSDHRGPIPAIFHRLRQTSNPDSENDHAKDSLDLSRARRQDAHAVIKYITATLLEVRPGFGVSPVITELTASSVEALVFGEIYSLIIEEVEADYSEQDNALLEKIADFERLQAISKDGGFSYKDCISEPAVSALHQLPQAHSAVDKLRYCVGFLEKISDFFASNIDNKKRSMGADSLLKMVCQHILVAKVFAINAQVAFLEEFARDEQLLRGKEGYALVTLQASLHFLNASNDFEKDIFDLDDDL